LANKAKDAPPVVIGMDSRGIAGIVLLALGGSLLLDSVEYVLRIAFITTENVDWFSLGTFTAFLSLLLIGLGIHFIIESAAQAHQPSGLSVTR